MDSTNTALQISESWRRTADRQRERADRAEAALARVREWAEQKLDEGDYRHYYVKDGYEFAQADALDAIRDDGTTT